MVQKVIGLLAVLESLESTQLNLGLYNTRITAEDLRRAIAEAEDAAPPLAQVEAALRDLVAQGEVIEWRPGYFRSRIAETVRCLRLLRQRLWWQRDLSDAPLLVEDVRVEFRQRRRPKRDAVPVAEALPADVPPAVARAFQNAIGFPTFSGFQARAIKQVYACARQGNPENESFIIAGDTGAGKTEAFLFPILLDIASEPPEARRQPGVRAVLVYPRIRLARNQLGRLLRYTGRFHAAGGPRITIGIQNGDVPRDRAAIAERWPSEEQEGRTWHRVDLLETCVECEAGHYWLAADDPAIETGCPRLVCDRCGHVVDTLHVTQAALTGTAPDILIITDVSLSQWLAREKYTHLWGLWQGELTTVPPRFLVLDEVHLYERLKGAHIARLIKRFQARVRLVYAQNSQPQRHSIVIGASATLHDERRFLAKLMDVDPQDRTRYERLRVVKPREEELEPTEGRERYIFIYPRRLSPTPRSPQYRVNDQTAAITIVMCAMHNLKTSAEWRGLSFFDSINDLRQFYANYAAKDAFPAGANVAEHFRIRTDRQMSTEQTFSCCGSTCAERAQTATLHECPHFRAGDCWVFARLNGWNKRLHVADSVYAGAASQLDGQDLIPTSPSLEVGYDDDAIHLVYQHKAPPSSASFIQRRGRAGRDPDDSPVIITLLWPYRRDDAFYFFRPEALYDPAFDDAPLNAGNFNVQRTHTLLACLRRQNVDGIRDDPRILDFTRAGWEDLAPGDAVIQEFTWLDDP
ncbi:MAG: DEAD/DEAH box helicase, partial [Caldilineae bacterium]